MQPMIGKSQSNTVTTRDICCKYRADQYGLGELPTLLDY